MYCGRKVIISEFKPLVPDQKDFSKMITAMVRNCKDWAKEGGGSGEGLGYGAVWFAVGFYVDNLQIVHSTAVDSDGNAVDPRSFYAKFISQLRKDWDIVDEGPMEDLLGIEGQACEDGSLLLHQAKYIRKMLSRFFQNGLHSGRVHLGKIQTL